MGSKCFNLNSEYSLQGSWLSSWTSFRYLFQGPSFWELIVAQQDSFDFGYPSNQLRQNWVWGLIILILGIPSKVSFRGLIVAQCPLEENRKHVERETHISKVPPWQTCTNGWSEKRSLVNNAAWFLPRRFRKHQKLESTNRIWVDFLPSFWGWCPLLFWMLCSLFFHVFSEVAILVSFWSKFVPRKKRRN